MPNLSQSPKYRKFSEEVNKALERILDKYQIALSEQVDFLKDQILDIVTATHSRKLLNLNHEFLNTKQQVHSKIDFLFKIAATSSFELFKRMRLSVYTLATTGEAESIGRALGKQTKFHVDDNKLTKVIAKQAPSGGSLKSRLELYYDRLKRDVLNAIDLSFVMEDESLGDVTSRIERAFPSSRVIKKRPRELKKLQIREADIDQTALYGKTKGQRSLAVGFVDEATWDDMLEDYTSRYLPKDVIRRGPEDKVLIDDESERYRWEVESELNEDFVKQVRDGQRDAAKENGIQDFMWVAIIDDKTDDCCRWRDGLTSSQIESELSGKHKNDDCDATTPPAHFNCRCAMAPVTKELLDDDNNDQIDYEDLNSWLES